MEAVFRALGDPVRRELLDRLYERDGQTLSELEAHFAMTRFGVMKHLRLLEQAGLVVTRRSGRAKYHYLNPLPIRALQERWIGKFAEPWLSMLQELKDEIEGEAMSRPQHVFQIYIGCSAERLWEGITNGDLTRRYFHATAIESDWKVGSPVVYRSPDGSVAVEGEVLEVDAPGRLSISWKVLYDPERSGEQPSRVSWEIEPAGASCKLTVVHDEFEGETKTYREVGEGWVPLLSSLKSLLETGQPLDYDAA